MCPQSLNISESVEVLNDNLIHIGQVCEWADLMGYKNTKKFSRRFLRYYSMRPGKILISIRLKSIYEKLREGEQSNFHIARRHSLPDEKSLNKFVNYHLGCSPRQLQCMPEDDFYAKLEKLGSKIR